MRRKRGEAGRRRKRRNLKTGFPIRQAMMVFFYVLWCFTCMYPCEYVGSLELQLQTGMSCSWVLLIESGSSGTSALTTEQSFQPQAMRLLRGSCVYSELFHDSSLVIFLEVSAKRNPFTSVSIK